MMTARLPIPGSDDGAWGQILNDFLQQAHNPDGSLKQLSQSQVQDLMDNLGAKANSADLAAVATSGDYTDLTNTPVIPDSMFDPLELGSPIVAMAPVMVTSGAEVWVLTNGEIVATPFYISTSARLLKIGFYANDGASAGAVLRLGVCANLANDYAPGDFVLDAGTVDATPAFQAITNTLATPLVLTPGFWWIVGKMEGSPVTPIKANRFSGSKVVLPRRGSSSQWSNMLAGNAVAFYLSTPQPDGPFPTAFPLQGARGVPCSNGDGSIGCIEYALELEAA